MRNAYLSRWLLLLAGLAALPGCAQMPGGTAYAPVQRDPRLAAERYFSPPSEPDGVAQTRAIERAWAKMGTGGHTARTPAVATARREEPTATAHRDGPVVHTSAIQMSALQPPAGPSANTASDASKPRTLWDKQPWEVELDKVVHGICRGC